MRKIIVSPGEYIQGAGELGRLAGYYSQLGSKKAYLIVDGFILDKYRATITGSFDEKNIPYDIEPFGGECSKAEIDAHGKKLQGADAVIGIGGGKTLDTAKAVGFYASLPAIIVPTAASNDAPCSRLSVVYKENGEFDFYLMLKKNPDMVIMDTEVIANAPPRYLAAGIGDALATFYEASAAIRSNALTMTGGHSTQTAAALARLCLDTLFKDGVKAMKAVECKTCTHALENVIEANTYLSGIGFESCGLAAAHAIHNGMTKLEETHKLLHGEKVAFGTLTQLVLENYSIDEIKKVIKLCRTVGLPTCFKDLGIEGVTDERLLEVARLSCDKNDTMGNMPFDVTPEDVVAAMKVADNMGRSEMD